MKIEVIAGKRILQQVEKADFKEGVFSFTEEVDALSSDVFCQRLELKKLVLSPQIKKIPSGVFSRCTNLEAINLDEVIKIEDDAFAGCTKLKELSLTSIQYLGFRAFKDCENLEHLNLNSKALKCLNGRILEGCVNLKVLILSDNISHVTPKTFKDCIRLEHIIVDAKDIKYFARIKKLLPSALRRFIVPLHLLNQIYALQDQYQAQFESACKLDKIGPLSRDVIKAHIRSRAPSLEVAQLKNAWKLIPFPCSEEELETYKSELERVKQRHNTAYKLQAYLILLERRPPDSFFAENERGIRTRANLIITKTLLKELINYLQTESRSELSDEERKWLNGKVMLLKLIPASLQLELGLGVSLNIPTLS